MTKRRLDPNAYLRQRAERVERIASALAAAIETVAPDEAIYTDVMVDAFERARQMVEQRRQAAAQQQVADREARAAAWRADRGLLTPAEYMRKHEMSKAQFAVAAHIGFLRSYPHPPDLYSHGAQMSKWDRAYEDRPLTPDELRAVADGVLLTANQAAAYLDITRAEFDKLKKKRGLQAAEYRRGNAAYPYALYRLADVQTLTESETAHE